MIYRLSSGGHDSVHTVALLEGPDGFDFKKAELDWLASEPPDHCSKDRPEYRSSAIGYSVWRLEEDFVVYLVRLCGLSEVTHRVVNLVYDDWESFNSIGGYRAIGDEIIEPEPEDFFLGKNAAHGREIQKIELSWIKKLADDPTSYLNRKDESE
jgi:hypothetical protein